MHARDEPLGRRRTVESSSAVPIKEKLTWFDLPGDQLVLDRRARTGLVRRTFMIQGVRWLLEQPADALDQARCPRMQRGSSPGLVSSMFAGAAMPTGMPDWWSGYRIEINGLGGKLGS